MFECEHISVELVGDKGAFRAVSDVSVCAQECEIVDIVGPSGAGKSTFLHALALLIERTSGTLKLDDKGAESFSPQEWRRLVALVQQKPVLLEGTIEDNLRFPWSLKLYKNIQPPSAAELDALMNRAGLHDIALTRLVSQLSVGQQARVAFMRTLITHPRVLLLDEVDAALDAQSTRFIGELTSDFAREGGIVLRIRHKLDDNRAAKRLVLNAGVAHLEMIERGETRD